MALETRDDEDPERPSEGFAADAVAAPWKRFSFA